MPITPIDIKTNLMANNDASRIREGQKAQESGQAVLVVQNKEKDQEKLETVQNPQAAEHRTIRKEDEDAEREKNQPDTEPRRKDDKPAEGEEKQEQLPDGIRGMKIDITI